jgi:hypothetical protein
METIEKNKTADKIIDGVKKAISEIEELRVKIALGKAEAKDLFEDTKKKLNQYVHESKVKFNKLKQNENISKIINAFEHLQIQLALGIAESKETFDEQKKNISNAIQKLESSLTIEKSYDELSSLLKLEIEKFKIKLEILNLQYRLKKVNVEQNFETKKTEFISKIEEIKNRIIKKENSGKSKWENFQGEIAESFSHLKQAFKM